MVAKIDIHLNRFEECLSLAAVVPGVGILAGALKVTLGFSQVVIAGVHAIWHKTFANRAVRWIAHDYSYTYAKHGVGNMIAGSLEALPLIGTALYLARWIKSKRFTRTNEQARAYIAHSFAHKWMPYYSLVADEFELVASDRKLKQQIIERYNSLRGELNIRNIDPQVRLARMQAAVATLLAHPS